MSNLSTPNYPSYRPLPNYTNFYEFDSQRMGNNEPSHYLLIAQEVWNDGILVHTSWGAPHQNIIEQKTGLLLGKAHYDPELDVTYAEVTKVIPESFFIGDKSYLSRNPLNWQDSLETINQLISKEEEGIGIIGWYHTHANDMRVYMSEEDKHIQKTYFDEDWQFAIVINPQQKKWRVFNGVDALECAGYVYQTELI